MSFTPEALYNIRSCDEQDNKKIFMSSPACADGYDTPAQQREDSTTFMVAKPTGDLGSALGGRTILYWWPDDGWQRGTVARLCPRGA